MKYSPIKIPSFGKIFGGKSRYARAYLTLFPHVDRYPIYCEPFAGGAGLLMNKERSSREILSDLDNDIFRVLVTLRDHGPDVKKYIKKRLYNYTEKTFERAKTMVGVIPPVEHAAGYIAVNRMSRSGHMKDLAVSNRDRGGQMGDKNAWENYINIGIDGTIARLQGVEIYNWSAFDVISELQRADLKMDRTGKTSKTLYYLDPPYLHETRVTKNAYRHEFNLDDHCKLLNIITDSPGKFFLSGYDSELYRDALAGWTVHSFERPSDSGQTKVKARRLEMLWESP